MSISSDGMLYFGFIVGEDDEPPEWLGEDDEGNTKDFDDFICELANLNSEAKYQERKPIIEACPAELQLFCSYDYPMYILAIRGYEHKVSRGSFKEITENSLKVDQLKIEKFKSWCIDNKIEYQEPKWLLCSMYG